MSQDSATNTLPWWKLLAVLSAIVLGGGYVAWEHLKSQNQKGSMMHSSKNLRAIASSGQQYILDQVSLQPEAEKTAEAAPLEADSAPARIMSSSKSGFILNSSDVSGQPKPEAPLTPEQAEMLEEVSKRWKNPIIYQPGMDVKLPGGEPDGSSVLSTDPAAQSSVQSADAKAAAETESTKETAP